MALLMKKLVDKRECVSFFFYILQLDRGPFDKCLPHFLDCFKFLSRIIGHRYASDGLGLKILVTRR